MTNKIERLLILSKTADKVNLKGRKYISAAAYDAEKELHHVKRMVRALELIERSDSFKGGTFVKELQIIAREALQKL